MNTTLLFYYVGIVIATLIALRTLLFWLQQWQIREYRFDRLWDHLWRTHDGRKKLVNLWFFRGILPRPKFTGRIIMAAIATIIMILGFQIHLSLFTYSDQLFNDCFFLPQKFEGIIGEITCFVGGHPERNILITILITERLIGFFTALGIAMTKPFVNKKQRNLFYAAKSIIDHADPSIVRVGISGSFGKSSTKELLVHILKENLGEENVLYNPANNNNEVAIAQLIIRNKDWFSEGERIQKVLVIETGAYQRGEVDLICDIVQPHYGIVTGLNPQHLSLFGSVENIQIAETELIQKTEKQVFYNAENQLLVDAIDTYHGETVENFLLPLSYNSAGSIHSEPHSTAFTWNEKNVTIPWGGKFFVLNALLALETTKAIGIKSPEKALKTIPPLERALHISRHAQGFTLLNDPYSANPDGVIVAIEHLATFPGRKIFVGIPLIELREKAKEEHQKIFETLKKHDIETYWLKSDQAKLGQEILGSLWKGSNLKNLKNDISNLTDKDALLLESRLPKGIL